MDYKKKLEVCSQVNNQCKLNYETANAFYCYFQETTSGDKIFAYKILEFYII